MVFNCACGTQVQLSRKKQVVDDIINLLCLKCFKETQPQVYVVEFDIFPFQAIYHARVFATSESEAFEVLQQSKEGWKLTNRAVWLEKEGE